MTDARYDICTCADAQGTRHDGIVRERSDIVRGILQRYAPSKNSTAPYNAHVCESVRNVFGEPKFLACAYWCGITRKTKKNCPHLLASGT